MVRGHRRSTSWTITADNDKSNPFKSSNPFAITGSSPHKIQASVSTPIQNTEPEKPKNQISNINPNPKQPIIKKHNRRLSSDSVTIPKPQISQADLNQIQKKNIVQQSPTKKISPNSKDEYDNNDDKNSNIKNEFSKQSPILKRPIKQNSAGSLAMRRLHRGGGGGVIPSTRGKIQKKNDNNNIIGHRKMTLDDTLKKNDLQNFKQPSTSPIPRRNIVQAGIKNEHIVQNRNISPGSGNTYRKQQNIQGGNDNNIGKISPKRYRQPSPNTTDNNNNVIVNSYRNATKNRGRGGGGGGGVNISGQTRGNISTQPRSKTPPNTIPISTTTTNDEIKKNRVAYEVVVIDDDNNNNLKQQPPIKRGGVNMRRGGRGGPRGRGNRKPIIPQ